MFLLSRELSSYTGHKIHPVKQVKNTIAGQQPMYHLNARIVSIEGIKTGRSGLEGGRAIFLNGPGADTILVPLSSDPLLTPGIHISTCPKPRV